MKGILSFLIVFTPFFSIAQINAKISASNGVKWTEALSWKEVLKKAKKENKYIFIDCYATWCGPCKAMEKEVFSSQEVGNVFNEKFISIRVQMDKTETDKSEVRKWYSTARALESEYGVPSYPTFLFLSPDGELTYRISGYKNEKELIETAKTALQPGMRSPYLTYYSLLAKYQQGMRDFENMAAIADTAKMLGQRDIANAVAKEYRPHLLSLKNHHWLTRDNVFFMANFINGSNDPFFSIFYSQSTIVDSLLGQEGFAQFVVDTIIYREEITPITKPIQGASLVSSRPDEAAEPNWSELEIKIAGKYNRGIAKRNVLKARVQWCNDHHDWAMSARYLTMYLKNTPPTLINGKIATFLNFTCWDAIFKRSVDKEQIDIAIIWMEKVVDKFNTENDVIDTYANLLYKAGRSKQAIHYEEQAVRCAPANQMNYRQTLLRMKEGKPTWPRYISNDFWDKGEID